MNNEVNPVTNPFRDAMAALSAPVTVITALDEKGPHGTTVSAFMSLSMAPPMALVSLDRSSNLLAVIRKTRRFGVNILASHQSALASGFARKGVEKFDGIGWTIDHSVPRLPETLAWVSCSVREIIDGGDHEILLGTVESADSSAGEPLMYFSRTYGTHAALEEADLYRALQPVGS